MGRLGRARLAFEAALDAAHAVVYATLDLPGAPGDDRYGIFRLVMDPDGDVPPPLVLAHNSGTAYFAAETLDETALCADAASWSARAELATVRRGSTAASVSRQEWPALLAAEDPEGPVEADLVEVVLRRGTRPLGEVRVVRISKERYDDLAEELARTLLGSEYPAEDVLALQRLLELDPSGSLPLERVP